MGAIAGIFLWIGAGWGLRRARVPGEAFDRINAVIIWGPLPATILLAIHGLNWDPSYWIPISMAWIVFLAAAALFLALGKILGWSNRTVGGLILAGGLGNTSFVGYPLLRALYGERAIAIAVLTDQPGSFLVLSTLGLAAATFFAEGRTSVRDKIRKFALFPPVWALLAAVLLRGFSFGGPIQSVLALVRSALIPLALISVGGRLRFDGAALRRERAPLIAGLAYKLVLAPLLMTILFVGVLHRGGESVRITILEAAMGPMVTGAILAEEHGLNAELCSLLVSLGIPLCLIGVPLWAKILERLGV
jgi:predicted permease